MTDLFCTEWDLLLPLRWNRLRELRGLRGLCGLCVRFRLCALRVFSFRLRTRRVEGASRARRGTTWTQDSGVAWIRHADVRAGGRRTASHQGPQPVAPSVNLCNRPLLERRFASKSRTVESTLHPPRTPRTPREFLDLRSPRSLREFLPPRPPRGGERKQAVSSCVASRVSKESPGRIRERASGREQIARSTNTRRTSASIRGTGSRSGFVSRSRSCARAALKERS